MRAIILVG